MQKYYTSEKNAQVIISLLKQNGIKRVIASPGTTNMALVASMQQDSFFEMISAVDERSAAYMACGLAAETGEPVVISCTGATASRNYLPGLTEAFYRKLPVLAVTSTQAFSKVGHHVAQVIDRSQLPRDTVKLSVGLPIVKDDEDLWDCEIKVNQAILELKRAGGGPAHINLPTTYSKDYDIKELPFYRCIKRIESMESMPDLPDGRIAVLVGSHVKWDARSIAALERFCEVNGAVVLCDHTSGYEGKHKLIFSVVSGQKFKDISLTRPRVLIHIGEVTGDYYNIQVTGDEVWRVSPDGEIRDTFRKLSYVFELPEAVFFENYSKVSSRVADNSYLKACNEQLVKIRAQIPDLPFSNIWVASQAAHLIPQGSTIHFGILNSLRAWNFFDLPEGVVSASNVGGFGIDGGMSSLLGASFNDQSKLYFCVIGDLAFFYDMNSLGNRHVGKNIRILLVNNGKGTEFRNYGHVAHDFGEDADEFISAGRHFGNKSPELAKGYVKALGFEYLTASSKDEFMAVYQRFLVPEVTDRPMLFEVFTDSDDESKALEMMMTISKDSGLHAKKLTRDVVKGAAKGVLGERAFGKIKKALR